MDMSGSNTVGCEGTKIRVWSGSYLDLADPQPDQFTIEDIACGLSKACRFSGQLSEFYSVAEHSLNCQELLESYGFCKATQAAGLMHDAAEAFLGDCVRPLKNMLPAYREIETRLLEVIFKKYGIGAGVDWWAVKEVDDIMLFAEKKGLGHGCSSKWPESRLCRSLLDLNLKWCGGDFESVMKRFCRVAARLLP